MPAGAALSVGVMRTWKNQPVKITDPIPAAAAINPAGTRQNIGRKGFFSTRYCDARGVPHNDACAPL
jgi:hypothetical protein